jgi:GT2 family glycosyltransferase
MCQVDISIIIINWNTKILLVGCIYSIYKYLKNINFEIIIIDNNSSDGSVDAICSHYPEVRLIANCNNVGFGRANNQAMRVARGRYFLLLNSDTLIIDDSIQGMVEWMDSEPSVGLAGCKLLYEDRSLQPSCRRFPTPGLALIEAFWLYRLWPRRRRGELMLAACWPHNRIRDVDWVSGAVMLVRREVFDATGGFDERIFMYGEDMEWCMRIRDLGWRITFVPDRCVVHLEHKSADKKYGQGRVELCQRTLYEVYRRRHGHAATYALLLINTAGTLLRFCYFGMRALAEAGLPANRGAQFELYKHVLKYQLRVLLGREPFMD